MNAPALRRLKDLPGPRGLPLLGNTLQVKPPRIHQDVEAWAAEFGPLFRMQLGRRQQLVIADHELLTAVMRDRPDGFRRSPLTSLVGAEMGLPQGLFGSEGEDWRKQRRMVMASFAPGHVRAYFPSLVKVTLRLRWRWHKAVRQGQDIPLQADLMRFTVDAIAGLAFGKDINTLESGEDVIQRHLDKVLPAIFRRVLQPGALLALVQARVRPRAGAQRGGDQQHHPRVHRAGAAAAARRAGADASSRATCSRR